jgi:hypothetical protein
MDPIEAYLDDLARRLRLTPAVARRFLTEAEAHLRDLVDEQTAAGADRDTAGASALARFGTSREVARSANGGPFGIIGPALLALAQLAAAGCAAVLAGTLLAELLARLTSTGWVFAPPRVFAPTAGQVAHWLQLHPSADGWRSAAAMENAADSLVLRGATAAVGLAVALGVLVVCRRFGRIGGGVVPAIGLTAFGGAAVLLAAGATTGLTLVDWGRGQALCDAAVALGFALVCLPRCLRGALVDG